MGDETNLENASQPRDFRSLFRLPSLLPRSRSESRVDDSESVGKMKNVAVVARRTGEREVSFRSRFEMSTRLVEEKRERTTHTLYSRKT